MYWTFVGISSLFLIPSVFFLVKELLNKINEANFDQELEIRFLKKQLLQIEKEKGAELETNEDSRKILISRKILKLNQDKNNSNMLAVAPTKLSVWVSIFIVIVCLLGTHLAYLSTSNDFLKSQSTFRKMDDSLNIRSELLSQTAAENLINQTKNSPQVKNYNSDFKDLKELVEKLKTLLKNQPNDLKGQVLLSKNSARLGDFITARKAQLRILEIIGSEAKSVDYSTYAEFCIIAASGYISIEAKKALNKSILLDKNNNQANFYQSLFYLQQNKISDAFESWINLLKREPNDSTWVKKLIPQITQLTTFLADEAVKNQKVNPNLLLLRLNFFKVLKALENRLERYEEPLEAWISLLRSYQILHFDREVEINLTKIKVQFSLSDSQFRELRKKVGLK